MRRLCAHSSFTKVDRHEGSPGFPLHEACARAAYCADTALLEAMLSTGARMPVPPGGTEFLPLTWIIRRARERDDEWRREHTPPILTAMRLVIRAGANVDGRTYHAETALHIACSLCVGAEVVAELLAAGADVNAIDLHGNSALYYAVEGAQRSVLSLPIIDELLNAGADVLSVNDQGQSVLDVVRSKNLKWLSARFACQKLL